MISRLYVSCGNCGHQFGRYGIGSVHEIPCPKCGANLQIEILNREARVFVVDTKQERKDERQAAAQTA